MQQINQHLMKQTFSIILLASALLFGCSKSDNNAGTGNNGGNNSSGQGGSLARFTIAGRYLYVVDDEKLYTYSLGNSAHPQLKSTVNIGFSIETIYPYGDKLFIGSQNAMYIYSIADPELPASLGTATHVRSCDPVVANDSLAYVTVRSGSNCGGNINALLVYDIRNVLQPKQLNTVPLTSPWGLGMKGNRLYVCNGTSGLNVYDITNADKPRQIKQITDETFFDVIITPDNMLIAMIQGGTALYQLKANDEMVLLAKITQ